MWEPIDPRGEMRFGSALRVRRCTLAPGHDGPHQPEQRRRMPLRLPNRQPTRCGVLVDDGSWITWQPQAGDPLCPACHEVDDDEQEAFAI